MLFLQPNRRVHTGFVVMLMAHPRGKYYIASPSHYLVITLIPQARSVFHAVPFYYFALCKHYFNKVPHFASISFHFRAP
jgi:hypothetical protein